MISENKLLSFISPHTLDLIILPTEQCNFRCTYCYEDFSIGKMQPETILAIKKLLILRMPELRKLNVSWFGGEPLAAKDIVYDISHFIMEQKNEYPDLIYTAGITTNAFNLKLHTLETLVKLNIKHYQISLDGTEHYHNRTRKRLNNTGTFNQIWNNLIHAHRSDLDFNIVIRVHITPENLNDIFALTQQIKAAFGCDTRFSVFFKVIENLGGPHSNLFKTIHGKDKPEILQMFYKHLGNNLKANPLNVSEPYVCYAAKPNSMMIRANGDIGKCTVALSDQRNNIGKLCSDGKLLLDSKKINLWTRGLKTLNRKELHCPMSSLINNV